MILLVNSEGPDQTAWMHRLIWAFAVCIPKDTFAHGVAHTLLQKLYTYRDVTVLT